MVYSAVIGLKLSISDTLLQRGRKYIMKNLSNCRKVSFLKCFFFHKTWSKVSLKHVTEFMLFHPHTLQGSTGQLLRDEITFLVDTLLLHCFFSVFMWEINCRESQVWKQDRGWCLFLTRLTTADTKLFYILYSVCFHPVVILIMVRLLGLLTFKKKLYKTPITHFLHWMNSAPLPAPNFDQN